jgi:hypothetical protein
MRVDVGFSSNVVVSVTTHATTGACLPASHRATRGQGSLKGGEVESREEGGGGEVVEACGVKRRQAISGERRALIETTRPRAKAVQTRRVRGCMSETRWRKHRVVNPPTDVTAGRARHNLRGLGSEIQKQAVAKPRPANLTTAESDRTGPHTVCTDRAWVEGLVPR